MAKKEEEPQLSLPVDVRNVPRFQLFFSRSFLSFRYTSFFQVLSHPLLWLNIGIVLAMWIFVSTKEKGGELAWGLFSQGQFLKLSIADVVVGGMAATLIITFLLSWAVNSFGKGSLVSYLFVALFVLFVAVLKVTIFPFLLLQH